MMRLALLAAAGRAAWRALYEWARPPAEQFTMTATFHEWPQPATIRLLTEHDGQTLFSSAAPLPLMKPGDTVTVTQTVTFT